MSKELSQLRETYLELVNHQLPEKAKSESMPVRFNHCFGRIILDNLFERCWYEVLSRKQAAYKQLNKQQLQQAIAIANQMLQDPKTAVALNQNSLKWRGKSVP